MNSEFERRLAILDAVTAAVTEPLELDMLLDRALATVLDVAGVTGGGIFLVDEISGDLRLAQHRGVSDRLAESYRRDPGPALRQLALDPASGAVVQEIPPVAQREELREANLLAFAGIPLRARGQGLGVLVALSQDRADFHVADLNLLVSIGRQIGVAIERARLFARERRRAEQLETISEVGRGLATIRSEQELLPQVVASVRRRLGYDSANVLLLNEAGTELVLAAASGLGNEDLVGDAIPLGEQESMAGWVIAHGEPLLANDVSREPRHYHGAGVDQAELVAPIRAGGRTIGVLDVQSAHANAFNELDIAVLQTLAGQIGVAIENARLYEQTERSLRRARAFQQVATAIAGSLDLETTLDHALDAAMSVFGGDRAGIYFLDEGNPRPFCVASRNLPADFIEAVGDFYATNPMPVDARRARSFYLPDAQAIPDIPVLTEIVRREGLRSSLVLPLRDGVRLLGVFVLYHNRVRRYSDEETAQAQTFADQAAIAIRHARLFEAERRAREQTAAVLDATRTVASSLKLRDVLVRAAYRIAAALRERYCGIWMLSDDETLLTPVAGIADPPDDSLADVFRDVRPVRVADAPRIARLLRTGEPQLIDDFNEFGPSEQALQTALGFRSYIDVPLVARERVLGIAAVPILRTDGGPDDSEIDVAAAIARSAALAVENARLYEQSRRLAASEERNRLARELHDSVTQSLFSMTLISQALPRMIDRDPQRAQERIERLNELGRGALAEMRALIFELRPAALAEDGLAVALTRHTAAYQSREGIKVDLRIHGERRLAEAVEEAVFRVAQEALHNVAKHARATFVTVTVTITDDAVQLTVTDDGIGFDPTALPVERRTLGLTSMGERASLLGGLCTVDSAPGKGATVRLMLPLSAEADGQPPPPTA
ncbi:MAG: GAF domain-containing protein [Dehalococcoidia bacterium]